MPAVEVIISGHLAGEFCQNVLHVQATNIAADPLWVFAKNIADSMIAADVGLIALYLNALPADYKLSSIRVRQLNPVPGPTFYYPGNVMDPQVGQRAGEISSAQVCPLIVLVGLTIANKTGRIFLPGVSEDDIGEMLLSDPLQEQIGIFFNAFIVGDAQSDFDWKGAIYRRGTGTAELLGGAYVSPRIGTQRRRLIPV